MMLMLGVIFVCLGLGLLAPRFGPRQFVAIACVATTMTTLYLFVDSLM